MVYNAKPETLKYSQKTIQMIQEYPLKYPTRFSDSPLKYPYQTARNRHLHPWLWRGIWRHRCCGDPSILRNEGEEESKKNQGLNIGG